MVQLWETTGSSGNLKYPEFWKDPAWKTTVSHTVPLLMYYYVARRLKSPIERVRYQFWHVYIYIDKMILNGNDNPSRKKHFQIEKTKAVRCGNRINPPFSSLRRRLDAGGWVGTFLARATWQVMVGTYPISPQFFNGLKKRFSEGLNGWTNADFKNEGPALFRHLEYD